MSKDFTQIQGGISIVNEPTTAQPANLTDGDISYSPTLNTFIFYQAGAAIFLAPITTYVQVLLAVPPEEVVSATLYTKQLEAVVPVSSLIAATQYTGQLELGASAHDVVLAATRINARYFGATIHLSNALSTVIWITKDYGTSADPVVDGVYVVGEGITRIHIDAVLLITGQSEHEHNSDKSVIEIQVNEIGVKKVVVPSRCQEVSLSISDTISVKTGDRVRIQASTTMCHPSVIQSNSGNTVSVVKVG